MKVTQGSYLQKCIPLLLVLEMIFEPKIYIFIDIWHCNINVLYTGPFRCLYRIYNEDKIRSFLLIQLLGNSNVTTSPGIKHQGAKNEN